MPNMPPDRYRPERRSYDPLLGEVRDDVREVKRILGELVLARSEQGNRIADLEKYQEKTVEPFINSANDLASQAKGAGRMVKWIYAVGAVLGVGTVYKIGTSLIATFIQAVPK